MADGWREYKLRWKGYSAADDEWKHERECKGIHNLIIKYNAKHKLEPSKNRIVMRAREDAYDYEPYNWVTMDQIIRAIQIYGGRRYNQLIPVEELQGMRHIDTTYLISHNTNVFVGLHLVERHLCLLADGTNYFLDEKEISEHIDSLLGFEVQGLRFDLQSGDRIYAYV